MTYLIKLLLLKRSVGEVSIFVVWAYSKTETGRHPTSPKHWSSVPRTTINAADGAQTLQGESRETTVRNKGCWFYKLDQSLSPERTIFHKPHHLGMSTTWEIMEHDSHAKYNNSLQSFVKYGYFHQHNAFLSLELHRDGLRTVFICAP